MLQVSASRNGRVKTSTRGLQSPAAERRRNPPEHEHHQRRTAARQRHAVYEPAMAFLDPPCAERVRDERIEAEREAHREDDDPDEERAPDAGGANRFGTDSPDHQRVDDAHRHPAHLRQTTGSASRNIGLNSLRRMCREGCIRQSFYRASSRGSRFRSSRFSFSGLEVQGFHASNRRISRTIEPQNWEPGTGTVQSRPAFSAVEIDVRSSRRGGGAR